MPKEHIISPQEMLKAGSINFNDIPVCTYNKKLNEEKDKYSSTQLKNIFIDIAYIRNFEQMLLDLKIDGCHNGIKYTYSGPGHLSIGEEAIAVGEALCLEDDDISFGTHRSHGELIARGLAAIRAKSNKELEEIMENYLNGDIYRVIKKYNKTNDIKDEAIDFFLYGMICEIFAKANGFQRGIGGSMHVYFTPFGVYPNNAIVGGSFPIAVGAALYKKTNKKKGIVIANGGDGSIGSGVTFEAMNFASMAQYKKLWKGKSGLPILFAFSNNGYAMGGQTSSETMAFGELVRVAGAFADENLVAERVNGMNPLAVADAVSRMKNHIKSGGGACMLDLVTYRFTGHSHNDKNTYRTEEEIESWRKYDPYIKYKNDLIESKISNNEELEDEIYKINNRIDKLVKLAVNDEISPYIDLEKNSNYFDKLVFSNEKQVSFDTTREPEVEKKFEDNSRIKEINEKGIENVTLRDALFESILLKFYEDSTAIGFGEDMRNWGGVYGVTRGLTEALPYHRFFNSPISESNIIGAACGYALSGGRALVEIMYSDFIGRAGDEIFNQLSKWQAMSAGQLKMPVVVRVSVGGRYGTQHSQDFVSLLAHIPGLKIAYPATPYDAKGLMQSALDGTDPVIFFESQKLYGITEKFKGNVPEKRYSIELGESEIKRTGKDVTIITIGSVLYDAIEAADELKKQGVSCEIIDLRSIVPINYEKIISSVKKTKKVILASDACTRGSVMNDVAMRINELIFDDLEASPIVLGAKNIVLPPEQYRFDFAVTKDKIISAIQKLLI